MFGGNNITRGVAEESLVSADAVARRLAHGDVPETIIQAMLNQPQPAAAATETKARRDFIVPRILHAFGSALRGSHSDESAEAERLPAGIGRCVVAALRALDLPVPADWSAEAVGALDLAELGRLLHAAAFQALRTAIIPCDDLSPSPASALRSDEIVWGRAPVRFDLAGGWTDTPPYAFEEGGCVLNAAVLLNTQPPLHVFARVIPDPLIRLRSIDVGSETVIRGWDELCELGSVAGEFVLTKAALTVCGFEKRRYPSGTALDAALCRFGGGLELTTLAAIPKGSGLGSSSILGAVLIQVLHRVFGRSLSQQQLFQKVLQLEQFMTTGGGWQDQVGGSLGGLKLAVAEPGLIPEVIAHYLPADVLDPRCNGGQTLLYYTGITRLAKNILQQVVGRWLDRDPDTVAALHAIGRLAREMAEAVSRKDEVEFGRMVGAAWKLNKRLHPDSSTAEIDGLFDLCQPYVHGAKLLGAGGGGFLLLVCKSPAAAAAVRRLLENEPPNDRARFFDFEVASQGLACSVC